MQLCITIWHVILHLSWTSFILSYHVSILLYRVSYHIMHESYPIIYLVKNNVSSTVHAHFYVQVYLFIYMFRKDTYIVMYLI